MKNSPLRNKILLIKQAYGKEAFDNNVTFNKGQENAVSAWYIEGVNTLQELEADYPIREILSIYDSGV